MANGSRTTLDSATRFCCQPMSVTFRGVVSGARTSMRLSCSATQFALLRKSVSLPMTCWSELFEIKSGDEIKTMRAEAVPGVAVDVDDAAFSTDTARANGPFGSESCFWGC